MENPVSKGQARYALGILLLINTVNYMDRSVVTILFPQIQKDLMLTDTQLGLLGGLAFTLVYALAAMPLGWATDRFNRRYIISAGIFIWSAATYMSGVVSRFSTLFAARSLTAIGEASCLPCGLSLISDYFSTRFRTTAIGIFQLGIPLGGGLGMAIGGVLAATYGWRTTFYIYAVPGILLIPFILLMKDPVRGAMEEDAEQVDSVAEKMSIIAQWKGLLKLKSLTLQYLIAFFTQFGMMAFSVWVPTYMVRMRGFEIDHAGKIMGLAFLVGGTVGAIGGGTLADRWFKKDSAARVKVQSLCLALTIPFLLASLLIEDPRAFVPSIFMVSILATACYPVCSAIILDVLEPKVRGIGTAALIIIQNGIGLTLASLIVGAISDITGSLLNAMLLAPVAMGVALGISLMLKQKYLADFRGTVPAT